ncbi:sigma-70 family RNA polymerase sigma factor [Bacillus sp. JJ722]|uniref:sigma-70 family RNA polymerase sigma factor n=1 Tax=Bacillus sp. JJ722 TaxID=3122973 RepID=UPI003000F38F
MEDKIQIEKAREGCNESFEYLIKSRKEKLYKIAFCYVKNEHLALEAVAEATYKSYIAIKKLKQIEFFDSWLARIVINEAINILRKQKRTVPLSEYEEVMTSSENDYNNEKLDLQRALEKIKKVEKEIIVLKYFGDLSFSQIGKMLEKTESTVKTIHYRALHKIKIILQGE